jgi:serine/threonine protein kinase
MLSAELFDMANPHMLTSEYRLLRRVGRGGMGEVWEAARMIDHDIAVPCAIKLLHAEFTETARERKLFLDEARIATQLDNSRIVKITGMGTSRDGRPFLVMERVDGVDLRSFVEAARERGRVPLDVDVVTYIVGEVLVGLAYAHERVVGSDDGGIIHSDVTPGNILISSTGEVKLTDFGIARFAATAGPMSRAIGTARYMSPEQLYGEPQRATDVYGLGVVLHELLEGSRFLDELPPDQLRSRVLSGPPPELTRTDVPKWLDDLRRSMIATDPRARPQAREALAIVIERSPRYMSAVPRLTEDYAALIGRRRSGVTLLHAERAARGGAAASSAKPVDAAVKSAGIPASVEDAVSDEIEPTQLLPAAGSESMTTSNPHPATPVTRRWVVAACLGLSAVLGCVTIVLFVDTLREPETEPIVDAQAVAVPAARPVDPEVQNTEPPAPVPEAAPKISPTSPPPPDPGPAVESPEPKSAEAEPKPEPAVASKPKPAKVAKVGVVFFVESRDDGQLKIGSKILLVKNRSAYTELAPGKYSIGWQPEGTTEWQSQGRVTIDDVAPSRYKVRLKDGKIVEAGKL